jgi:hypothetical protein
MKKFKLVGDSFFELFANGHFMHFIFFGFHMGKFGEKIPEIFV